MLVNSLNRVLQEYLRCAVLVVALKSPAHLIPMGLLIEVLRKLGGPAGACWTAASDPDRNEFVVRRTKTL